MKYDITSMLALILMRLASARVDVSCFGGTGVYGLESEDAD